MVFYLHINMGGYHRGIWIGSNLTRKYYTRLEWLAWSKCSSLFGFIVSNKEKKFYNTDYRSKFNNTVFPFSLEARPNKLERLTLASFSSMVKHMQIKPGAYLI